MENSRLSQHDSAEVIEQQGTHAAGRTRVRELRMSWLGVRANGIRNWLVTRRLRADDGQPTARPSLVAQAAGTGCPKLVYKFRTQKWAIERVPDSCRPSPDQKTSRS